MNPRVELQKVLDEMGPDAIWRPIYSSDNELLVDGIGDPREAKSDEFSTIDYQGKTVLDVGCNLGHFSFQAKRLGASHVIGLDIDENAIKACNLLKTINGINDIEFRAGDFAQIEFPEQFDIGMLVCFFGKNMVRKGIHKYLTALEINSKSCMVVSARPYYRISKHLGGDPDHIAGLYPEKYIQDDFLFILKYVQEFYADNWEMTQLSPDYPDEGVRRTLLFTRK